MHAPQRSASGLGTGSIAGAASKTQSTVGSISRGTSKSSTVTSLRPADWEGPTKFGPASSTLASHARTSDDRPRSMNPPSSTSGWSVQDSGPVSYNAAAAAGFQNSSSAVPRPLDSVDSASPRGAAHKNHRKSLVERYKRENSELSEHQAAERPIPSTSTASMAPSLFDGEATHAYGTPAPVVVVQPRTVSAQAPASSPKEKRLDEARASVLSILNRDRSPSQYNGVAEASEDAQPALALPAQKESSQTTESASLAGKKRKATENLETTSSQSKKAKATTAPANKTPVARKPKTGKGKDKNKQDATIEPEPAAHPRASAPKSPAKVAGGAKSNKALRLVAAAESESDEDEDEDEDEDSSPSERHSSNTKGGREISTIIETTDTAEDTRVAVFKPTWKPELQNARCMSVRYKDVPYTRCMACTRRWAGDTCRFQNVRYILRDRETREVKAYAFTQYRHNQIAPDLALPEEWKGPMTLKYIQAVKSTVAKALYEVLKEEKQHVANSATVYRCREMDCRATCDTCMTSLFSSVWICRYCGREVCGDCFKRIKFITYSPPEATAAWAVVLQQRRTALKGKAFSLLCSKKREHTCVDFTPITRFRRAELEEALPAIEALAVIAPPPKPILKEQITYMRAVPPSDKTSTTVKEHPSHSIPFFDVDKLNDETFKALWAQGSPVVVHGLTPKLGPLWTPEFFIDTYDAQTCSIVDCQTDEVEQTTVGKFFSSFGKYQGRENKWKLKDWPSTMEFEEAFPDLHDDFCKIVPMPDYVRPDGRENLAGYYPLNVMGPDLGPKMYNAYATTDEPGSQGTTKLHMDMSDAVNIMTSACKTVDGGPGYAIWDIFRASDSRKIRDFLDLKFMKSRTQAKERMLDPIHSQRYYLDSKLLTELRETHGIKSYRIYQEPGQAVFIPAGCAHQVANKADCVKVAIDFVSLENISRCEQLTREFREANEAKSWKEDVLQLRTMMWFAWLTCCKAEKALQRVAE